MTAARFQAVHPVLPVRDLEQAVRYYVDRLGFQLVYQDPPNPGNYGIVRRDDVTIHLQWHAEADFKDVEAGTLMVRFAVDDPDALYEEYRTQNVFHDRTQLRDTPWGTREFAFFDLNGHGLTFYLGR